MTNISDKENVDPKELAAVTKLRSTLAVSKTRSDTNKANSSVRRTTTVNPTSGVAPAASERVSSLSAGKRLTMTREDIAQQQSRGKQVFDRVKGESEQLEKEKKEREEAAEKGRQASREWAEKRKQEVARQTAAKLSITMTGAEGGRGTSAVTA